MSAAQPQGGMSAAQLIRASQGRGIETYNTHNHQIQRHSNGLTNTAMAAFENLSPSLADHVEGMIRMNGQYVHRLVNNVQLPFQDQNLSDLHDAYAQRGLRPDSFPNQMSGAYDQECSEIHDALDRLDLTAPVETGSASKVALVTATVASATAVNRFDTCAEIHKALDRLDAEAPVRAPVAVAAPTREAALTWSAPKPAPAQSTRVGMSPIQLAAIEQLFNELDTDGDGNISSGEFHKALTGRRKEKLRSMFEARNLDWKLLFKKLDKDGNDNISLKEFAECCNKDCL